MPEIRAYCSTDIEPLLNCWEATLAVTGPALSTDFIATERENIRNIYIPNTVTTVSEIDGNLVGFLTLMGNEVAALFVFPNFHRQGIARDLLDNVRQQFDEFEVDVFEANTLGRSFYDAYGFSPLSESIHEPTGFNVLRLKLAKS